MATALALVVGSTGQPTEFNFTMTSGATCSGTNSGDVTLAVSATASNLVLTGQAISWNVITKNQFLAGPVSGSAAAPTFRVIDAADLPTPSNGASVLGSTFTLNAADNVGQDTGVSVSLPSAGTYLIQYVVRVALQGSSGSPDIVAYLYNATTATAVANSELMVYLTNAVNQPYQATSSGTIIISVAAANTIKLYAFRNAGGGTITQSLIASDSNGRTSLSYVRLGA